jgi:hypothetical protein
MASHEEFTMRRALSLLLCVPLLAGTPYLCFGQTPPSPPEPTPGATAQSSDLSYHLLIFVPSYRAVSTRDFAGRVGEYDSLRDSAGGDLTMTLIDRSGRFAWRTHATVLSQDEYDIVSTLRAWKDLTVTVDSRSLRRHLDNVPFGTNLSPDDILRTEAIPENALFGVKRTRTNVDARWKVADSPVTLYARGGWQGRSGQSQLQYFDMGGDASCGSCHSASRYRPLESLTRSYVAGAEYKVSRLSLAYEHAYSKFDERQPQPVDAFGATLSLPDDELPAGVADTLPGNYLHNVLPSHHTNADTVRLRVSLPRTSNLTGSVTKGRTVNTFTGNPQSFLNANARLSWSVEKKLRATADYHRQEMDNDFTPFYSLFGNPSLHRYWGGFRLDYAAAPSVDVETHYRHAHMSRSNSDLWPQFYSPGNADLLRVVPTSSSNTLGVSLRLHGSDKWDVRPGYEWIDTRSPGYLTEPGTAHRLYLAATVAPVSRLSFSDDFSVLLESSFAAIQRQNRLYLNTAFVTVNPVRDWNLGLGYTYFQDNLKTDLIYGTDPFYREGLVPFKALSQGYTVSSSYLWNQKLGVNVDFGHVTSHSEFRPTLENDAFPVVAWSADFSRVSVPQFSARASLDYRFQEGVNAGFRFDYARYTDRMHPELNGRLRTYSLFLGRTW